MVLSTVKFISSHEQQTENSNLKSKDVTIVYLKATIVILIVVLSTVSGVLLWKVVKDCSSSEQKKLSNNNKEEKLLPNDGNSQFTQIYKKSQSISCPLYADKTSLPYTLQQSLRETFRNVEKTLKQAVDGKSLVSVSLSAVYRDDKVWNIGLGTLDKSTYPLKIPDEHSLYSTGSVVKILTVVLTFKLLKENKITNLNDPLRKYEPNFIIKNPFNKEDITIRQILAHTSGLPREVSCGPSFSSSNTKKICPVNTTFVLNKLKNLQVKFPPGSAVSYSNLGYALLANVLFEIFGRKYSSWQQWMLHEVVYPLGMTRTILNVNERQFYNTATGYKSNGLPSHHLNWGWASPSFQMKTSTSDLSKLMLAILNPGKSFIDEKMTKEMFKPEFIFPDLYTIFATGWQIRYHNFVRVVRKSGAVPGFSSSIILMPEVRFGFVLLASGEEIATKLANKVTMIISKKLSKYLLYKYPKITTPTDLNKYTGHYVVNNNWSDKVKATIEKDLYSGRLILKQDHGYPSYVYLNAMDSKHFRIIYPYGLPCSAYSLGQDKEIVMFQQLDSKKRYKKFKLGSFIFRRSL
ncbi:putative beta-lactamase-like 1 [Xenia sp. Carnegie-2017]|uniref:putative beta-lactamase-like 1 n=1 Tax=Xenia sp. Carnegie-2017 TaxID=2897299 RepID=UPI001F04EEA6|nr:putative beta-lactamase-like 1 [Xenia sp. Carnegie-2017]